MSLFYLFFQANGHDSNQSDIVTSNDSAPSTPEVSASDFSNISQVPRTQAYDSVEHTPEFQVLRYSLGILV